MNNQNQINQPRTLIRNRGNAAPRLQQAVLDAATDRVREVFP